MIDNWEFKYHFIESNNVDEINKILNEQGWALVEICLGVKGKENSWNGNLSDIVPHTMILMKRFMK